MSIQSLFESLYGLSNNLEDANGPIVQQESTTVSYLSTAGFLRAIEAPTFTQIGIFDQIRYSEYVLYWLLPILLWSNILIGPWKVFRASVLWISGLGTFTEIWTIWWSKLSIFWVNVYLQMTIPLWFFVQFFGVPLEVFWFFTQLSWWMFLQSLNFIRYNIIGAWEMAGILFGGALYVNYKYAEFINGFEGLTNDGFWYMVLVMSLIFVFWPLIIVGYSIYWNLAAEFGYCPPDVFCYGF